MTGTTITYPTLDRPDAFTQTELGWVPWIAPVDEDALDDRQRAGLIDASRAKSPYFRLLARDPDVLAARTRTDKDIFYNTRAGLPRAERELAAATASRVNGCVFCASVHSRFASHHSKRPVDVQRLLDEGASVRIDERWDAIIDATNALTQTPAAFGSTEIERLQDAGLDDLAILDVIQGGAFFNWANRLMLSLGEPENPPA